jgi:hypothetical protein
MIVTLLALAAGGQAATGVSVPPAPATMQQRFNAASDAAAEGRCAEAVAGFETLEAAGATRRNALLAAAVDVRKGGCLVRLDRAAERVAAIRRGLPVLAAKGGDFALDARLGHAMLGLAAWRALDYDEAAREYQLVADSVQGLDRIGPLMRVAQATMFDHDGRALAAAGEARRLAMAAPSYPKKDVAAVQTQYARVLLNEGRAADAYRELKEGLARQGGLTSRVGVGDIATRSDLAIAALKTGDAENARRYLAYTGAGRMKDTPFSRAAVMDPPLCGEGGITPKDQAIVEFTLEEDGRVSGVMPIYTTGGRPAAIAFARAVSDWSWRAKDAKEIPILFRYTTRVELRCTKAVDGERVTAPLREAAMAWLDERAGPAPWGDRSEAAALPFQRAALAQAQAAGDQAGIARAAMALGDSLVTEREESKAFRTTVAAAAKAADAPAVVRNYIALRQESDHERPGGAGYRRDLRALLAQPEVAGDRLSAHTLRLLIARPGVERAPPPDAAALQAAVADDAGLPANHPLKVAALLDQANTFAIRGDTAGARAAFGRTGLTGEQCAQLGLSPQVRSAGASSDDYPMAAYRMGFEGWVMAEADVTPDGRTVAQRAVVAYPPFVFDEAATGIARGARYFSSFRPDGALACQGARLPIKFLMP